MSKALAEINHELTTEQMDLIKSTIAKNATSDELKLFLYRCRQMGLDPLKPGHIHFVKYGNNPGTIIIGIDGFRSKASLTGKHTGTKRGVLRDAAGTCVGGWCEVYRSDWTQPAREEVSLHEYNTGKAQWAKMPETMIKKVAEVSALRMAFPEELGGVYSDDEMAQATPHIQDARQPVPNPFFEDRLEQEALSYDPGLYEFTFGKFKGKSLKSINSHDLNSYCEYIYSSAEKDGKPIQGVVKEALEFAEAYLKIVEFQR